MRLYTRLLLLLLLSVTALHGYNFGQNKVNDGAVDWSVIQTLHFDIYFPSGHDEFGKLAALMAEETYYYLKDDLRFPVNGRIPIIFYGNKREFQSTNIIYPLLTEGVGGFTESLHNRVVIPFEGSYSKLEELLVHELTHAYVNALDRGVGGVLTSLRPVSFPFWFSEGLPEFLSIGGEDAFNNMFILDMVVNDRLPSLEFSDGYYAYRLGESFLTYIANEWGRDKVSEYFFAIRGSRSLEEATKKVFGMEFADLESRWRYQLKRDYFPTVNSHGVPKEVFEQRTFSDKDGSYFNYMPRFSPNGQRYVYFSNAGARYSVWIAGTYGLSPPRKLITGEAGSRMEEFTYFRANLAWFPDNRRVAFAAKATAGDRIHILDVDKGKILRSIRLDGMDGIFELDVSPDGKSIVFSGQEGMKSDLYLYHLEEGSLQRLTDDYYYDAQPRFSPDGKSVIFASERINDPEGKRRGFFSNYRSTIFGIDLQSKEIKQYTFDDSPAGFPMLDSSGNKLYYISQQGGISNYRVIDLVTSQKADVTQVLAGIYAGDISPDGKQMVLSNYFRGAWNIYMGSGLMQNLNYSDYPAPVLYSADADLLTDIDLERLDIYGKRPKTRTKRVNPAAQYDARRPILGTPPPFEYAANDSLYLMRDFAYDDRPTAPSAQPPQVKPYRARFALDRLWGGLAYSSSAGTFGYVELGLSDIMGNHGIGINAGISGKISESNILLTYLYLKQRMDYGVGVFNLFDEALYRRYQPGPDDYFRLRERQTGLYGLLRYPFSRFFRVEFDQMLYQRETGWDYWIWSESGNDGVWQQIGDSDQDWVYSPGITLVHDNSLYGSTGPLVGWKAMYSMRTRLTDSKPDHLNNYLDWRTYSLFSKRYALAFRTIAGVSVGSNPDSLYLGGYNGVRAFDDDLYGQKKLVLSAELRFPFFEYIAMAFPVPLTIPNVRGNIFVDAGTVFNEFDEFRGTRNGKLEDIKLSYGWGPRLNLGYVVLKLDIAWLTNLSKISKPTYYLSLTEDF